MYKTHFIQKKSFLIGAGEHAKVVIESARRSSVSLMAAIVDASFHTETFIASIPIIKEMVADKWRQYHIAIGDNSVRKKLSQQYKDLDFFSIIDPHAIIAEDVTIGRGVFIAPGVIINPGVSIGDHCIINTGAIIEHDCHIASFCHVAPGAVLAGGVHIGEGAFIGAGSTVVDHISIGAWSFLGAGACAVKPLPEKVLAVGVPCKVIRQL